VLARSAAGCLIAGFGLLTVADAGWAHAIGVVSLLAFVVIGFAAVGPAQLATADDAPTADG
jgi:cytochrome d ubiquinol oxidase subunit II